MKLLSLLIGVCFIFSFSQKTFACGCDEGKKADQTSMSSKVADAKEAPESHTCDASGKQCTEGKDCSCSKDKKDHHMKHKDGKACGCADKAGKLES